MGTWILKVEEVHGPSQVLVGDHRLVGEHIVVGRGHDADWVLADTRVSRRHARFTSGTSLVVEPEGSQPVYVNAEPVTAPTTLAEFDWVQLGGVLLRVFRDLATDPPAPRMGVMRTSGAALLAVEPAQARASLGGHELRLRPGPFRALTTLAERPGAWVSAEELAQRIWAPDDPTANPAYVHKYISAVRVAIRGVLAAHASLAVEVHQALARSADAYSDADAPDLALELVKARKRVGYRLSLGSEDVGTRLTAPGWPPRSRPP